MKKTNIEKLNTELFEIGLSFKEMNMINKLIDKKSTDRKIEKYCEENIINCIKFLKFYKIDKDEIFEIINLKFYDLNNMYKIKFDELDRFDLIESYILDNDHYVCHYDLNTTGSLFVHEYEKHKVYYSYSTPIMIKTENRIYFNPVFYSMTTSKHFGQIYKYNRTGCLKRYYNNEDENLYIFNYKEDSKYEY